MQNSLPQPSESFQPPALPAAPPANRRLAWAGLLFALVFPTVLTWAYFIQAAAAGEGVQRTVMGTLKLVQFAFPLVWVVWVLRERIAWQRFTTRGVALGVGFGLLVTLAGWGVFRFVLAPLPAFQAAIEPMRAKIAGFGIDSVAKYAALGLFYSLIHSFLEEYYWRWFVFGQLRRLVPLGAAIAVSSLAFASHHVLVLAMYFGWTSPLTWLFSAAVAIGGAFWAWLYDRTGSLAGPWLSHLVIDAGIFLIGFELVRATLGQ
ncbi:MAG: CPBP family intramembrane glutamic endopeptidase [Pirellulales bacterium]